MNGMAFWRCLNFNAHDKWHGGKKTLATLEMREPKGTWHTK